MRSIEQSGGLESHLKSLELSYSLFVLMAEANWDKKKRRYNGIRSMARIMGTTDTTIHKYLRVYDSEIGRIREQNKNQDRPGQ